MADHEARIRSITQARDHSSARANRASPSGVNSKTVGKVKDSTFDDSAIYSQSQDGDDTYSLSDGDLNVVYLPLLMAFHQLSIKKLS